MVGFWHKNMQNLFDETEVYFEQKNEGYSARYADAVCGKYVVEFQHSHISRDEIEQRMKDYSLHGREVVWVVNGNRNLVCNRNGEGIRFIRTKWSLSHFSDVVYLYVELDGYIYKFLNKVVLNFIKFEDMIKIPRDEFKKYLLDLQKNAKKQIIEDEYLSNHKCELTVIQKGAGSGKTFSFTQAMIESSYRYVLCVTKQHSAKEPIRNEVILHLNNQGLDYVINDTEKKICISVEKLKKTFVILTLDSLYFNLHPADMNARNAFTRLVQLIIDDGPVISSSGAVSLIPNTKTRINQSSIICLDEAEMVATEYMEALMRLMVDTNVNVMAIGDLMQSINGSHNALKLLLGHYFTDILPEAIKFTIGEMTNEIRRCSSPKIIDFINKLIPFKEYGLPRMTAQIPVADDFDDSDSLKIIDRKIYTEDIPLVKHILEELEPIILKNGYTPGDIAVVSPFVSDKALKLENNMYVQILSGGLEDMWGRLFNNPEYLEKIKNHEYWGERLADISDVHFVTKHSSEEQGTIDLKASTNKTRIYSIHASQGDGRNVIIGCLLGDKILSYKTPERLAVLSKLHVAITRQKKHLLFVVEKQHGWVRSHIDNSIITDLEPYMTNFKIDAIEDDRLNSIYNRFPYNEKYSQDKGFIDTTFQDLRNSVRNSYIFLIIHHSQLNQGHTKKQILAILYQVINANVEIVSSYQEELDIRTKEGIPVRRWLGNNRSKQPERLKMYIKSVQVKLKKYIYSSNLADHFCPVELIAFQYCIDNTNIHRTLDIIDKFLKHDDGKHSNNYKCLCSKYNSGIAKTHNEYHAYIDSLLSIPPAIEKALERFPKRSWRYTPKIFFDGVNEDDDIQFQLGTRITYLAYNDEKILLLYNRCDYNNLNHFEYRSQAILDAFLIMNIKQTEGVFFNQVHDKEINVAIIGNTEVPYTFILEKELFQEHNNALLESIFTSMLSTLRNTFNQLLIVYEHHLRSGYFNDEDNRFEFSGELGDKNFPKKIRQIISRNIRLKRDVETLSSELYEHIDKQFRIFLGLSRD